MDTRTPRTPDPSGRRPGDTQQGGPSGFFDDEPGLSTVKVPSDPAEVVVTHASFRVQLAPPAAESVTTGPVPAMSGIGTPATFPGAAPGPVPANGPGTAGSSPGTTSGTSVVWGVGADADDTGATRQYQAARPGHRGIAESAASTTQVLPRIDEDTLAPPTVVGQRGARSVETTQPQSLLHGVRPTHGAFDGPEPGAYDPYGDYGEIGDVREPRDSGDTDDFGEYADFAEHGESGAYLRRGQPLAPGGPEEAEGRSGAPVPAAAGARRQAYYPGRRMNLGVVLLPMRIFLGFISVYAGMGKLCDPVYFDGAARGSMVTWLRSLEPWTIASPLRDFALAHPVGSGLTVAFLQIIIGVLTVCGLWQRVAAAVGALLSAALLMTVSWSSGPAYEAPDIILLAAWSPLLIAGAPVYSVDGRLAADAWRKLGPRAELRDLRLRVLRRGAVIASVVTGIAMLTGSVLGGAVRSAHTAKVPEPGGPPVNQLPGSPLPEDPDDRTDSGSPAGGHTRGADADDGRSGGPSSSATPGERQGGTSSPSQRETVQVPREAVPGAQPPRQSAPGAQATQGGGASSGSSAGGSDGGSNSGGGGGGSSSDDGGGSSYSGGSGGGLGGLLG
ncbi:DoxX family protein [Streptomyces sp. WMMB 322]|uniref:DoxX family protein n=1 Tax=Streptomyces sp. WMMB 322 TaxID=1286821 RepID=UPI0006E3BAB7|nr:DoxX family protein [Streptomyces sp. WMMB 322]SCK05752.1 Uncharacterized membrane protein YphA, DoxX/SURF4 family [Streptomyces sp. WMMB 322]